MARAPSGDVSLTFDTPPGGRAFAALRYLAIAIAIAALFACATSPSSRSNRASIADVAFVAASHTVASAEGGEPTSHHWGDDRPRDVVDVDIAELDGDEDEDESPCTALAASSFRCAAVLRGAGRASRGELPVDPSCFACGTGLPRGPPA